MGKKKGQKGKSGGDKPDEGGEKQQVKKQTQPQQQKQAQGAQSGDRSVAGPSTDPPAPTRAQVAPPQQSPRHEDPGQRPWGPPQAQAMQPRKPPQAGPLPQQQRAQQQQRGPPQTGSLPPPPPQAWGSPQRGPPQTGSVPPQQWRQQRGPPQPGGAPQYGPPQTGGAPQYGPPQTGGAPQYGPPQTGGAPQYGPPQTGGASQYGPPQTGGAPQYGPPQTGGAPQYGPPRTTAGPPRQYQGQDEGPQVGQGWGRGKKQGQPQQGRGRGPRQGPPQGRGGQYQTPEGAPQPPVSTSRAPPGFSDQPHSKVSSPEPQHPQQTAAGIKPDTKESAPKAPAAKADPKPSPKKESGSQALELVMDHKKRLGGKNGRKILIESNHLSLNLGKLKEAYHYDVAIDPDKPKKLLRKVMEEFRIKFYRDRYPAFDGVKNLYASKRLASDHIDGEVTVMEDDREKKYKVAVKFANAVDLSSLNTYLNNISKDGHHLVTPQEAIQCVDIVLRSAPAQNCITVGRSFFTKPNGQIIELGNGMQMYHGFYQSAILGWKPFLNVDVAHKAFPKNMCVIDLILEIFDRDFRSRDDLKFSLHDDKIEILRKFLTTLKVTYEIPGNPASKRVYRVNGLKGSADKERFSPEGRPAMTIVQYFQTEKRYPLKFPKLPCIWVGNRERTPAILLPAELCIVQEGQVVNRKMDEVQTSNMIKYAATSTRVRKEKIFHSYQQANYNTNPCLREFGFSVGDQFERVQARVLEPPKLQYNGNQIIRPSKGVWRNESSFQTPAVLQKWTIVNLNRRTPPDILQRFADMICKQARTLGMNISKPEGPLGLTETRRGRDLQDLIEVFKKKRDMRLIVVVIPDFGPHYSYVKQAAELNVGCLTQCIKAKTMFKMNPSTIGNILLKVNAKLNGVNHSLSDRPRCLSKPCMIMGADVTHPSPDSVNVPSVAAVTASHDPKAFKYNICWRLQPPKMEIIQDLENIVKEQMMFFYTNCRCKPENIVFFRDGVSEGQFEQVLNAEVQAIRRACISLQKDGTYKPAITFLVVQKRHHTRFFPTRPEDSDDRNFNVPAGTCVDTVITHPTAQDFYLVSHASIQGVAKPTKYRTLWDDLDMSDDEIEQLTYYLCHMFTRCNRSVSYPAPTYYAHLAAARAKVYCENESINLLKLDDLQARLKIKEEIVKMQPMFFV